MISLYATNDDQPTRLIATMYEGYMAYLCDVTLRLPIWSRIQRDILPPTCTNKGHTACGVPCKVDRLRDLRWAQKKGLSD
jgi:hypothetical protein